jgi:hypothetical protein
MGKARLLLALSLVVVLLLVEVSTTGRACIGCLGN